MALVRLVGIKQRERLVLLVLTVFVFCLVGLSPGSTSLGLQRLLSLVLFPTSSKSYADILRFVNPLIGTTNGGAYFSSRLMV